MNVLALDTALGACSAAAVRSGREEVFRAYEERERNHAEAIVPMINAVMGEAGLAFSDLERIAVTVGPGTFTGVRVGVATARGLALATGAPLVGVTTLALMARQILDGLEEAPDTLGIAVDARRGQVYFALFDRSGRALSDHLALTPAEAAALLPAAGRAILAGTGAQSVAGAASRRAVEVLRPGLQPDAATLARMAPSRPLEKGPLNPLYLRAPDAKPQAGKAVPRLD